MTKREDLDRFADALAAVIRDCDMNYPQDHLDWTRDSKHVHQNVRSRGIGFVTLDLPVLGDWLLAGLTAGRLDDETMVPSGRRRSRRDCRPRLFWGLWSRLFDERGLLLDDPDPTALFLLLTVCNLWKKVEVECRPGVIQDAYEEYFEIERDMTPSSPFWDGEDWPEVTQTSLSNLRWNHLIGPVDEVHASLLEDYQFTINELVIPLGVFLPEDVVGRHGPGAVSDMGRKDDKYAFPTWPEKLDRLFPKDHHAVLNASSELLDEDAPYLMDEEVYSYLTHVPKTQKAPRLIAEEPTCHQWIQQGVSDILRDRVKRSVLGRSIDFFDQTPSQDACRAASVSGDACTIDLSSASDRMSTWLVERVFSRNLSLLDAFQACRTRFLRQDRYEHLPESVKLKKFASMGSALTFPVQSIVFACLTIAVGRHLHPDQTLESIAAQVRVFGDDIVCPVTWVVPLTELLTLCGLKVNSGKSFSHGKFRESCGLYAYKGHDVTPFRIRKTLSLVDGASHVSWLQGAYNAHIKGLWNTSQYMESQASLGRKFPSVPVGAPPVGLPTYSRVPSPSTKYSWNEDLQKWFVDGIGFRIKQIRQRVDDGVNSLLRLSRSGYKTRTCLADFMDAPAVARNVHELLEVVDGPAFVKRTRTPLEQIYPLGVEGRT